MIILLIKKWRFFKSESIFWPLALVFLLKSIAGYISYQYHSIYFAGGDGAIYMNSAIDLIQYSQSSITNYLNLFFNLHRGEAEWELIYQKIMYWDSASSFNFINDNRTAIRVNSLIALLSFNNTLVHILLINFLSLIGLNGLYKCFKKWFKHLPKTVVFIAVFLSPSIIFWTSGILKETHSIAFIGLFFYTFSLLLEKFNFRNLLITIFFAFLLLLSRTYFSIVIFTAFTFLLIAKSFKINSGKKIIAALVMYLLSLTTLLAFSNFIDLLILKQQEFILIGENANSFFHLNSISDFTDFIQLVPQAFINVFLQTQLLTFDSWLYLFPIIENIDSLLFLFLAIRFFKKPSPEIVVFSLSVLLVYFFSSIIIGSTVPIQGAISRYKSLSQPFLLIGLFSFIDWKKIARLLGIDLAFDKFHIGKK